MSSSSCREVVIALGSNLGNRAHHLWKALRMLPKEGVKVYRHSCLYETYPAYVMDQPHFLNAAILATTELPPQDLLAALKHVEAAIGRDLEGGLRWGPRPLDLDVIFYGEDGHSCDQLQVPHPRWVERPFVKAPVSDLLYDRDTQTGHVSVFPTPSAASPASANPFTLRSATPCRISHGRENSVLTCLQHASRMWSSELNKTSHGPPSLHDSAQPPPHTPHLHGVDETSGTLVMPASGSKGPIGGDIMRRVLPLGYVRRPDHFLVTGDHTHTMGILNYTPDSFSDGGQLASIVDAVASAKRMVQEGASFIDVGGQSTRPGATRISAEEEAARVVPLIRALRQDSQLDDVTISVDTFYADVARDSVLAGADVINDVSGGSLDPNMLTQVAELGVPYILMHMRGNPTTMQSEEHTAYHSVWRDVGTELQSAAERAMAAGVPAWNIILDPGIGFSKTPHGNVELIRHLADFRSNAVNPLTGHPLSPLQGSFRHAPILVGPSRKGFLGMLTGRKEASQRDAATVAACVACVGGGADIVRAHNVQDVTDGVRVADAVYRPGPMTVRTG